MVDNLLRIDTEILVIGSGPGGAMTACRLAEAGRSVLVVEEGQDVEPGRFAPFSLEQMEAQYRNAGLTVALGRPPIAYAEGRCLGGGSEINSGLYHRPPPEALDEWRRDWKVDGLDDGTVEAESSQVEAELSVGLLDHPASAMSQVMQDGARALGWAAVEVPRWIRSTPGGSPERQSMTRTFLPRAQKAGATVLAGVRIDRLLRHGGRVTGAVGTVREAEGPPRPVEIRADAVFVSCGAIQSPALLQRSGFRGRIGRNLQMHPTVKAAAGFAEVFDEREDVPVHQVKEFGPNLSFGGSASRPGYVALAMSESWGAFGHAAKEWATAAVYYAAIRPQGTGTVTALPGVRDPLVTYRLTRTDLDRLRSGLLRLSLLLLEAGAHTVYPSVAGAGLVRSRRDLADVGAAFVRSTASVMTVHLFSSAPMGEDPSRSPVDSYGRVRGQANLYVNDASLLPTAPGVNPQGTILMVASRNARHFLAEH